MAMATLGNGVRTLAGYGYQAFVNTPWAIDAGARGLGNGIAWGAETGGQILQASANAIVWTARGIGRTIENGGNAGLWGLRGAGRTAAVVTGAAAMIIGYPVAVVGLTVGSIGALVSLFPCWAAMNPPTLADRLFTPIESSARSADATACPALVSTSVLSLTLGTLGLMLGRIGRRAF